MEIKVFGQLKDILHHDNISIESVNNVEELKKQLQYLFPDLSRKSFVVAVNRKVIHENILLQHDAEIALLPPFSGG
ncbi:MAG TPA: MoaD/ThiS family protein [Hanamia sp.]|nr:MoaD/ThiS family protein [Hanamia sp.]